MSRWLLSMCPRVRGLPPTRHRRTRLICYPLALIATATVLLAFGRSKSNQIIVRNRPVFVKPPLVDRARMGRLGMYDEPEPSDVEWMGSLPTKASDLRAGALLVTQLPDSNPAKQKKNSFVSNSLADWRLCGFRDRPCRVLLPASIGEQESKAQLHLQQVAVLARTLDLTLVLPKMHKARFGACARNNFEDYYQVDSLTQLGVRVVPYAAFLEWTATRRVAPKTQVIEITAKSQSLGELKTITKLGDVSNGPSWRRCLAKSIPRLDFAKFKLQLAQKSTRLVELVEFGQRMIEIVRPIVDTDDFQVYALDWSLRHLVFEETRSHYLTYAKSILDYAEKLLDSAGPTVAVQWRMESVPPENLLACSSSLITLLEHTLTLQEHKAVNTVYFATDYPLEDTNARHSGTFRNVGDRHHAAILKFRNAFQPGRPLETYKLTYHAELSRTVKYYHGFLENDFGLLGIVDKVISQKAELFISGSVGDCARNSSFTKQIIDTRRENRNGSKVRNDVWFFERGT